ncbi:sirohydrochlorin chelatase [Bacterioplanoides pacificum]|uniref:Sirohydrochlorin chelatase n=1 Tax=Bacterioplanoides pacificum TaxID=1171596 RepID=A0ABV7VVK7_9GAMM
MTAPTPNKASILLAHGSSDPNWLAPFETLLQRIRGELTDSARVELAYMELAQPSMEHSIQQLAEQGFQVIDVLPLFFAAGRHLRKDVPAMLNELQQRLASSGKQLTLELHQPIGLEPEMASAISQVVVRKLS